MKIQILTILPFMATMVTIAAATCMRACPVGYTCANNECIASPDFTSVAFSNCDNACPVGFTCAGDDCVSPATLVARSGLVDRKVACGMPCRDANDCVGSCSHCTKGVCENRGTESGI